MNTIARGIALAGLLTLPIAGFARDHRASNGKEAIPRSGDSGGGLTLHPSLGFFSDAARSQLMGMRGGPAKPVPAVLAGTGVEPRLAKLRTVRVWLAAFIPRDITGYTKTVPGGPHAGKTMIPGPTVLSDCFLTDQRTFEPNALAPARMNTQVLIDAVTGAMTSHISRCDATIEVDCEDGDEECNKSASAAGLKVLDYKVQPQAGGALLVTFKLVGEARNGCFSTAPTIDWNADVVVEISADKMSAGVRCQGLVEPFPSFEMYASGNDRIGSPLLMVPPVKDATPWDLIGAPNRKVAGSVTIGG